MKNLSAELIAIDTTGVAVASLLLVSQERLEDRLYASQERLEDRLYARQDGLEDPLLAGQHRLEERLLAAEKEQARINTLLEGGGLTARIQGPKLVQK